MLLPFPADIHFDTELAIYAHERAFEYFGGKPEKIVYDQDRVLISRENL